MKTSEKKVLLTGGSGLIGKEAVEPLLEAGCEVHIISTKRHVGPAQGVRWVQADLFDLPSIAHIFSEVKPDYLLHFAWIASGDYLASSDNFKWLSSSMAMLKAFADSGGTRAVFAGTCFEYEFKDRSLKESDNLGPSTIYAQCKCELFNQAQEFARKNGVSFGWGRIFYVFGHNEFKERLVPHLITALQNKRQVTVNKGLIRDYMYTKDVAAAFVKFLDSGVEGPVNICRGEGIAIEDMAYSIARIVGADEKLIQLGNPVGQPAVIVGENSRLLDEVGYSYRFSLDRAIQELCS